jgi:hypothetical protein
MSSETWKKEVTAVRGEYSARLKRALHTNGNESSSLGSYPTPAARDYKGTNSEHHVMNKSKGYKGHMNQLPNFIKYGMDNWPTPRAGNPGSRKPGTGGKILAEEAKNWATPNTMDHLPPKTGEALARNKKKGGCKNLREDVNNPKMNWATPQASDHVEGARTATESNQKCLGRDLARLDGPQDQVSNSTSGSNQESWPTANARDWKDNGTTKPKSIGKTRGFSLGQKMVETNTPGKLNPAWVCQLMGLPSGWTNLGCWATE